MRRTRLNSSTDHLHFGSLGNGVTVYDVTREKHGDYLTVAHIDPTGMVKYYVDVTPEERAKISEMANKEHNRWVANYNKRPVDSRFEELLDRVGWNDVHKAISKDIKNGYTMDEILDTYMPAVYYGAKKDRGYEYPDGADFNSARRINSSRLPAKTQRAIRHCINSARRRANLKANRRLNCGYYYDGEDYSEMGYDKEQDAYYDLPDEMYIYRLDLSQFTNLVRDGIVSKHEIHEWIDELSEDWGGMPAWSPAQLIDIFEIQDLTKEQYDNWKANFAVESVRFRDELERRY